MRLPHFDLSRLNPRNLFRRDRGNEPMPAAGPRFPVNAGRDGARPRGEASLRVPDERLPRIVPASALAGSGAARPDAGGRVRFDAGQVEGHEAETAPARSRADSQSGATTRSASPPPGYGDSDSEAGSLRGSPPPTYVGNRLHDDEFRIGEDGIVLARPADPQDHSGLSTPSTLELDGRDFPRPPRRSGSPGSLDSDRLEALLAGMPPLCRFPTPPPRDA